MHAGAPALPWATRFFASAAARGPKPTVKEEIENVGPEILQRGGLHAACSVQFDPWHRVVPGAWPGVTPPRPVESSLGPVGTLPPPKGTKQAVKLSGVPTACAGGVSTGFYSSC